MDALRKEEAYAKDKVYTIEDIDALPEGVRAELIDGQIYYMAIPSWTHQRISGKLYYAITRYIEENNGQCQVLYAPFAYNIIIRHIKNKDEDKRYVKLFGNRECIEKCI